MLGSDSQFDDRYRALTKLVEREPTALGLIRNFLLERGTSKNLSFYAKELWSRYREDYLGSEDGKKSSERYTSQPDFEDFLQLLWKTFWNESERNQTVMAVQLFLPVAGTDDEGRLDGGDLGRTPDSISSLRKIILEHVTLLGKYSHLIEPYVRAWLAQRVTGVELLGRLMNLVHAQRPVMQGSTDAAAPLAALAERLGPLYVFLMQRALALGLPPELRDMLAQSVRNLKAQVDAPKHWEVVRLISSTLPPDEYSQVIRNRGFVGGGKTWLSIGLKTSNGEEIAQIRRAHCEELIESSAREGFEWLKPLTGDSNVRRFVDLLPGALDACRRELNVHLSAEQLGAAHSRMHGRQIRIRLSEAMPAVTIHTSTPVHYSAGIGLNRRPYRRMSRLEGLPFSRWSLDASEQAIKVVAAANYFYGCVMLQRATWNEDPGAGNALPLENQNGFVDFGMLNLSAAHAPLEEKQSLGVSLTKTAGWLANRVKLGEALFLAGNETPLECTESATRSGVALGDWEEYLTPMERLQLFMAASRYSIDPIAKGFTEGIKQLGDRGQQLLKFREDHKAIAELLENP
jgi:hypothetical protein